MEREIDSSSLSKCVWRDQFHHPREINISPINWMMDSLTQPVYIYTSKCQSCSGGLYFKAVVARHLRDGGKIA